MCRDSRALQCFRDEIDAEEDGVSFVKSDACHYPPASQIVGGGKLGLSDCFLLSITCGLLQFLDVFFIHEEDEFEPARCVLCSSKLHKLQSKYSASTPSQSTLLSRVS